MKRTVAALISLLVASPCLGQDYFDWAVRTDRDGMPAGHYETTPFPITETTTSCVVRNDEHPDGVVFELGSLHFVDGAAAAGGDGSWGSPWATIAEAVAAVPAGNETIVVQGAHDGFDAAGLAAGESEADPQWEALPAGEYAPAFAALTESSPARETGSDLGAEFSTAFNNVVRPAGRGWDIGAVEYTVAMPDEGAETVEPEGTVETDAGEGADGGPEADAEVAQDAVSDPDAEAEAEEPDGGGGEGCGCRLAARVTFSSSPPSPAEPPSRGRRHREEPCRWRRRGQSLLPGGGRRG
jgi:hypothetical protein